MASQTRPFFEEQHIGLHTLGVEQAGGQAQQGVHIALVQQLLANGFARAAFKQHVVGQDHRRAAVGGEQRLDVLHKVELLVAGGGPEVVALNGVFLGAGAAVFTHDDGAALLAKRRVGQHHLKTLARVGRQRIAHYHGHRFFGANAVQHHVDRALPVAPLRAASGRPSRWCGLTMAHTRAVPCTSS